MNSALSYSSGRLHMDGVDLATIIKEYGTPLYLYSEKSIKKRFNQFQTGLKNQSSLICFSAKSNSNQAILKIIRDLGGGIDIVSGGELYRALKAGIEPQKIVFSGVGKSAAEIKVALEAGILLFSVESEGELEAISSLAASQNKSARVNIRVNPDIDAQTHEYISTGRKENKFGINYEQCPAVFKKAVELPGVEPVGVSFHIGSQITEIEPFQETARTIRKIVSELEKITKIQYVDVGGGLGIRYKDENPPEPEEYIRTLIEEINRPDLSLIFEPGRSLIGNAGILLTQILYIKAGTAKKFYICDAAMNDLMRPSYYSAYHGVTSLLEDQNAQTVLADLVGPICESSDFIAKDRKLPAFNQGDYAAVLSAGAYGFSMSSNYNSRPRAAEVLVTESGEVRLIRRRESYEDLIRGEEV